MNIFQLAASLVLNKDDFDKGLNDAEKEASGFGDKLKGGLATAGKIGAAALTATAAGAAALTKSLMSGTKEAAAYGDNIDKMSQKMGISAQAYQEWDFILQHSGASIGSLQASMRTLNNAVVSNSKAFTQLGISQEQVASLSREDLFAEVIKGLQGMEDETQRTALANALLGRGAMELGALLNTSAEDTEAMKQQVHELGGVMSDEAVKAAAGYTDAMQNLRTATQGLSRNLMSTFLPSVNKVIGGLTDLVAGKDGGFEKISEGIDGIITNITEELPKFADAALSIVTAIARAIEKNLPKIVEAASGIAMRIIQGIVKALPNIAKQGVSIIQTLVKTLSENMPTLMAAVASGIADVAVGLTESLPDLLDAVLGLMQGMADGIIASIPVIIEALPRVITGIVNFLLGAIPQIIQAGIKLLTALVEALPQIIDSIVAAIPDIIMGIINAILDNIPLIVQAGVDLLSALVSNIPAIISAIVNAIPKLIGGFVAKLTDPEQLGKMLDAGIQLIMGLFSDIPKLLLSIAGAIVDVIAGIITSFIDWIKNPETWEKIGEIGINILKAIGNGLLKVGETLGGIITTVGEKIGGLLSGVGDWISEKWRQIFGDGKSWLQKVLQQQAAAMRAAGKSEAEIRAMYERAGMLDYYNGYTSSGGRSWSGSSGRGWLSGAVGEAIGNVGGGGSGSGIGSGGGGGIGAFDPSRPDLGPDSIGGSGNFQITQNIYANQLTPTQAFEEAQNAFQMQQFLGLA